jgi:hypothetical protein
MPIEDEGRRSADLERRRSVLVIRQAGCARFGQYACVVDFGCDFCRDDQNRFYGHVPQIASSEDRQTILLRCPRCGALYENTPRGPDETRRLTPDEARHLFPGAQTS